MNFLKRLSSIALAALTSSTITFGSTKEADASMNCQYYRDRYEQLIRYKSIKRPSLVANERQAVYLAVVAESKGQYQAAAIRMMQASVIVEEKYSWEHADTFTEVLMNNITTNGKFSRLLPYDYKNCIPNSNY